jgi:hypothetical protein
MLIGKKLVENEAALENPQFSRAAFVGEFKKATLRRPVPSRRAAFKIEELSFGGFLTVEYHTQIGYSVIGILVVFARLS